MEWPTRDAKEDGGQTARVKIERREKMSKVTYSVSQILEKVVIASICAD